jgi:hypothetical protein
MSAVRRPYVSHLIPVTTLELYLSADDVKKTAPLDVKRTTVSLLPGKLTSPRAAALPF